MSLSKKMYRKNLFISLFILIQSLLTGNIFSQDSRGKLFNSDWKFFKGEKADGEKISTDDKNWRKVNLPHDWSIEGPFSKEWASGTGFLPGGIAWYRKSFDLQEDYQNKQLYLYFDGVYKNSEVWINEKYLGKRPSGYASFYYDITPFLKKGGKNLIAVKADHTDFGDSRWYSGSGINRNVYLITTPKTHIDIWGVRFTTPVISKDKANVRVEINVKKIAKKNQPVVVRAELLSLEGVVVGKADKKSNITDSLFKEQLEFTVPNPKLWSPEQPILYNLKVSLMTDGLESDVVKEQVGFRYFSFDVNKGFSLNGKTIKLKGVCFHDDAGALGSAVPRDVWERRLKTLREMGCNSIRMSHNPHQDYIYDLCDKLGFLVQDEAFDEWELPKNKWIEGWNVGTPGKDGYYKNFKQWANIDLRDMILRNRNRASIVMWSIGNEIDYPNDPYTDEILNTGKNPQIYGKGYQVNNPPAKRLGEIAHQLVSVVKQYDTTRPVTAALAGVVMSNMTTYPEELDVVGYNYQEYRYKEDHEKYPARIIYGSENGKSYEAWESVRANEYISGQYLWTAFDYIGEANVWPSRSNGAGVIDMAGFPKPSYYYHQAFWLEKPVLFLTVSPVLKEQLNGQPSPSAPSWNWKAGDSVNVECYTNAEEVELFLNGSSLQKKNLAEAKDKVLRWKILYRPGKLEAISFYKGKEVGKKGLTTSGPSAMLKAVSDKSSIKANLDEVAHVEILIQDKDGQPVTDAENDITITVEGPGKIAGLENGSLTSHEDYKGHQRKALRGKLVAYIQAESAGIIKLKITSANLKGQEIQIKATN